MDSKEKLIAHLEQNTKVLRNPVLKSAFEAVDRKDFVAGDYAIEAYEDYPLPIGYGQTISQPTTVAFMLELLGPERGNKILDLGSGSGWTTALLAHTVGSEGSVVGVEKIPELVFFAQGNITSYAFTQARIELSGKVLGLLEEAPFDKILVSAVSTKLPETLLKQLKSPGTLVLPIDEAIVKIEKDKDGSITRESHDGFIFVPLIE